MNRRQILKQLAMGATAAILLPSCISDPKKVSIALSNLKISGDEEELLAAMAETIIPETDKPGAKTTGAHLFTLVMVDDCADAETREKFLKGMRSFDDACRKLAGKGFLDSTADERLELLKLVEQNIDNMDNSVRRFYQTTRRHVIQGYLSSSYFMTEVKTYELVPGADFKGCVPVDEPKIV